MRPSKREAILDTAEWLFYEEGFHATGVDRVVEQAGVARMTLYNHFPSKDALVAAVLERRHRRYFIVLEEATTAARAQGKEPLLALVDAHCRWLATAGARGCMLQKAVAEYQAHAPAVFDLALEYKHSLLALIRELMVHSGIVADGFLDEELFLILEGANSLVQVVGPVRTVRQTRALARRLLTQSNEGAAV